MRRGLDNLLAQMRREGREYGRRIREEQGKPQMPEPVFEGESGLDERFAAAALEEFRIESMQRLRLSIIMTWSQFFDRKQHEIHPWVR